VLGPLPNVRSATIATLSPPSLSSSGRKESAADMWTPRASKKFQVTRAGSKLLRIAAPGEREILVGDGGRFEKKALARADLLESRPGDRATAGVRVLPLEIDQHQPIGAARRAVAAKAAHWRR